VSDSTASAGDATVGSAGRSPAAPAPSQNAVPSDPPAGKGGPGPGDGVTVGQAVAERLDQSDAAPVLIRIFSELDRLDRALYATVARTPTPSIDAGLRQLSDAANFSRLWLGAAVGLTALGGRRSRRASILGLAAIGLTSATVNLGIKPLLERARPDRSGAEVPNHRFVRMPTSTSFPSGHSASAFAFANAVAEELPVLGLPLRFLAGAVAYSRVHTGVHYPGDVMVGAILGSTVGGVTRDLARLVSRR
jgi:membrane-associated phospholipid phosphatase